MIQCFSNTSVVLEMLKNIDSYQNGIAFPVSDTEKAIEVLKETPGNFKGKINAIVPMPDKSEQIIPFLLENNKWLEGNEVIFVDYNSDGKNLSMRREEMKKGWKDTAIVVSVGAALAEEAISLIQCQAISQIRYWNWQEPIALNQLKEAIQEQYSMPTSESLISHNDSTKIIGPLKESFLPFEWLSALQQSSLSNSSVEKGSSVLPSQLSPEVDQWEPSVPLGTMHTNEQEWLERLEEVSTNTEGLFTVRFERGRPIEINGKSVVSDCNGRKNYYQSLKEADTIGKEHNIGFQIYPLKEQTSILVEAPGIALLEKCYEYLLQLILDRRARRHYQSVTRMIVERIFEKESSEVSSKPWLDLIEPITRLASGTIAVTLYKGNVAFHKASDVPHSLYSEETASMEAIGDFDHADSEGFLAVLGVGARASAVAGQTQE